MNNKIKGLLIATWMFAALFGAAKSTGEQATIKATDQAAAAVQEVATNQEILTSAQQAGKVHAWKHAVRALKPDATSQMVRPDRRFEMAARKGQYTRKESKIAFKLPFSASSGATQGASALPKSIGGGFSLAAVSTIAVFTNTAGDPITGYTIGDTIVWTITSTDTVYLEIYVDDGDSLFSAVNDFSFDVDDKGDNKITFLDNDIDDEDTTAGTWKITLDTGELSEGDEFFHLQGVRLWFAFSTALGGYDGELSLDVIAPPTTTTVSGTITVEGVPVPNVLAVAFPMAAMMDGPDEGGPEIFFIAMSGPSGEYAINVDDAQAGGEFMIMAFDLFGLYWGMYPDPPYIEVYLSAGDNPSGLSFDFQPVNSVIKGQLTDAVSTLGIAGVRVRAGGGPQELQDTTDAEGYYRIPVAEGDYRVDVAERDLINMGYMVPHGDDEWFWVADNDSIVVDFETYATDATITGTVLWSDGSPAVDIEVWGGVQGFHTNSWTDASGFYTLQVSSELDSFEVTDKWDSTNTWWNIGYWVNVHEEDVVAQPDGHHVRVGADYVDFTLFCSDATLSGIVYDFFGNPAPWSNLWAYTLDDSGYFEFSTGTQTWEDGSYELKLIGGNDWIVEVSPPHAWQPVIFDTISVFAGQNIIRDYYLPEKKEHVAVEGKVFNFDGIGIPNATVEVRQTDGDYFASTNTDGDGYFRIEGVPTFSNYEVVAYAPEREPQSYYIWVNGDDVWLEFWMGGFSRVNVAGTVTGPDGSPLEHAFVFAYEEANTDPIDVRRTNVDGFYDFFVEPGWYEFRAGAPGLLVQSTDLVYADTSMIFDFMLDSAGVDQLTATASGRVTDDGGGALPNVFTLFISSVYMEQTFTNFNGEYDLALVPSPDYVAVYYKEGFHDQFRNWSIIPGDNPSLDVAMTPQEYLELHTAVDVPDDHGEQIMLAWYVNPLISNRVTRFEIWEVGRGQIINPYDPMGPPARHVGTVPVHPGWNDYSAVVTTLYDGVETFYMVTAHGPDVWEFWDSKPNSATSIDNLPPNIPGGVIANEGATADQVVIGWEAVTNEPIQYYTIYRSVGGGAFAELGKATNTEVLDNLSAGGTYLYAVSATDFGGNTSAQSPSATYTYVVLSAADGRAIPDVYALKANYPNPFNPSTTIMYQLPEAGLVNLVIYDITGNQVQSLVDGHRNAGYHSTVWNGRDSRGSSVATGVYFYRISVGSSFTETHKMVLMK